MTAQPEQLKQATKLVSSIIKAKRGQWYRQRDQVGHQIYIHYGPSPMSPYMLAEVVYETFSWAWDLEDEINDALDRERLPYFASPENSYAMILEDA